MTIQSSNPGAQNHTNQELQHMAGQVKAMLHNTLDAFARMNINDIMTYIQLENNLNHEYTCICRRLISKMIEDPRNITRTMDTLWIAKTLERMGDYACHIGEHLIYMMTGEIVQPLSKVELEKLES